SSLDSDKQWWVSDGGQAGFTERGSCDCQLQDLRFGDFNDDGRTDVFSIGTENWQVSLAPPPPSPDVPFPPFFPWHPLQPKLTDSVQGIVVADFDGDGIADIAANCESGACWRISRGGVGAWQDIPHNYPVISSGLAAIGKFRGTN